jgi:hypothetical protein
MVSIVAYANLSMLKNGSSGISETIPASDSDKTTRRFFPNRQTTCA